MAGEAGPSPGGGPEDRERAEKIGKDGNTMEHLSVNHRHPEPLSCPSDVEVTAIRVSERDGKEIR